MSYDDQLTRDEQCLLAILRKKSPCTTTEILELSKEFPDLCSGCSSGTHVINAGMNLREKGLVARKWHKNQFVWELLEE